MRSNILIWYLRANLEVIFFPKSKIVSDSHPMFYKQSKYY
jgi:hypothetical protein